MNKDMREALTQKELKKILEYNPETGIFKWIIQKAHRTKIGSEAGTLDRDGYLSIQINRHRYQAHRLAWLYVAGSFPKYQIDHINGIENDNRFSNLREASNRQNKLNGGMHKDNSTGYKGVSYRKKENKYISQAMVDGKKYYLGLFDTAIEASEAYNKFAKNKHGEFYNGRS